MRGADDAVPVAIVGAGPVGLALALGLARHGVRSVVFERRAATSEHSKAAGIHVRTREVIRQWGVEEAFLRAGTLRATLTLHPARGGRPLFSMDLAELADEADRPGLLVLEQSDTERLLLDAVRTSGRCDVRFGAEVVGIEARRSGITLTVREGEGERRVEAAFAVGCDGASSFVRQALGLPFDGLTYGLRPVLADVEVDDARDALPWPRACNTASGLTVGFRLRPGLWRIIRLDPTAGDGADEVRDQEMDGYVREVLGPGPFTVRWASRFRIHRRSAPRFRSGRVLLAGDAAHVHSPVGGLGMNAGVQDAHNLAWKLAAALDGGDLDRLLDSYDAERRAVVVGSVSSSTDLLTRVFLQAPGLIRDGALAVQRTAMRIAPLRRAVLRRWTMIGLDYPASPLLDPDEHAAGVRLPNPVLRAPDGTGVRLYDLLPPGPVLLEVGAAAPTPDAGVKAVIRVGPDGYRDASGLLRSLLGDRDGWILVRPDAHIAWARTGPAAMRAAARHALGLTP